MAPEQEVIYPRINPNVQKDNELTNGHSHFVLIGDGGADASAEGKATATLGKQKAPAFAWGDEA